MEKLNNNALIIFARDPVTGRVKTRLNPYLDLQTACDLYTCFLADSIDKICLVDSVDRFVAIYPSNLSGYFESQNIPAVINVFNQKGKDLGERMLNAFSARFSEGYKRVVVIGTDSPSLPLDFIKQAFSSERDVVIGPSSDGGYYLIGMKEKLVNLFDSIRWGEDTVLEATRQKLEKIGASLELLPLWYDVDLPTDLRFLKTHLALMFKVDQKECKLTQKFLGKLSI